MKPYEIIDHTADIGLKIYGRNLQELFTNAALGLFNLMTNTDEIEAEEEVFFHLEADNPGDLLLVWLRELLFIFSTRKLVFKTFSFESLSEKELKVLARAGKFDPKRHEQKNEVKAVTYHQFKFTKQETGYVAEVIFDI